VIADGPPRRVLDAARDGLAELILPKPAAQEFASVLQTKLGLDDASVSSIAALLKEVATEIVDAPAEVEALSGDQDDDRIIAAAVAADADVLVSGDLKHVLPLERVGTMRIIRPQDLLAELAD
jgi:uncharacterized protein